MRGDRVLSQGPLVQVLFRVFHVGDFRLSSELSFPTLDQKDEADRVVHSVLSHCIAVCNHFLSPTLASKLTPPPHCLPYVTGVLRILAVAFTLVTTWLFANAYFNYATVRSVNLRSWLGNQLPSPTEALPVQNKCRNKKTCPDNTFNFRITSGAANVVGPSMCFDNAILMSSVKNNIGRGLNIALINGTNGRPQKMASFDMYSGDVKSLLEFLKGIERGTLVLIASYDDPATKLNDEARALLTELGSSYATKLGFRDNWIFLGGKGLTAKSPFEEYLKNNKDTNKYDGWPEVLEMEGCVPRKMD
ncbi:protein FAM3D [Tiliqua scincoides]|uniref:protein FAM3D n=1 Tax=Tiliqua scincoides TaxID=71010 RepID=UPI003461CD6D